MGWRSKLSPRKAPKQARSRETLDAIFEAALRVLEKQEQPSVHTIAERAGVSVGSLYQYFPSKEALASALIGFYLRQRLSVMEKELASASAQGLSAEAAATRLIDGFIDGMAARSKVERAMVQYFCRAGDLFALTQLDSELHGLLARYLRSLGPAIRPTNPELAAFLVNNTLRSVALLALLQQPERLADPELKTELTRMVVGYLRP